MVLHRPVELARVTVHVRLARKDSRWDSLDGLHRDLGMSIDLVGVLASPGILMTLLDLPNDLT
jgi:hypothetical protein